LKEVEAAQAANDKVATIRQLTSNQMILFFILPPSSI
jgi:hypothetical protein